MTEIRTKEEIIEGVVTRSLLDVMWSDWTDHESARFLDKRMRQLETQTRTNFIEAGLIGMEMSERSLWQHAFDPETGECFNSLDAWICSAAPVSRSSMYEAIRVLKALPELSVEAMKEIPRTNLRTLASLSSKVGQNPEVLRKAKELPEKQFVSEIQRDFPDQRLEQSDGLYLAFTKSQKSVFMDALLAISKSDGCTNWTEAAEALAVNYLNETKSWPDKPWEEK